MSDHATTHQGTPIDPRDNMRRAAVAHRKRVRRTGQALAVIEGAGVLLIAVGLQHGPAVLLLAAGIPVAAAPWLYLYYQARGPRSLFWLVLRARCERCGARENLRRWHRGYSCEDVLPCFDRARTARGLPQN